MEAGREMDALIAEKVVGWRCDLLSNNPEGLWYYDEHHGLIGVHKYSTDIAAAWLVEERIAELGLIKEYCMHLNAIANAHWDAGERQPQRWQLIHALPEDRCRAALLACEGETGKAVDG